MKDKGEKINRFGNIHPGNIATIVKINTSNIEYLPKGLSISFPLLRIIEVESSVKLSELNGTFFEDQFHGVEALRFWKGAIRIIRNQTFAKLPDLLEIRMNDCEVRIIEEQSFQGNPNLTQLFFSGNKIKVLPKGIFRNLRNLKRVLFILNQIRVLDKDLFKDNKQLKYIHFSVNRIQQLHPNLFRGLTELEEIGFSGNQIKILRENLFQDNLNLRIIRLYYNKIRKIHPMLLQNLLQLEHFGLDPNMCFNRSHGIEFNKKHSRNYFLVDLRDCYENWQISKNFVEQVKMDCEAAGTQNSDQKYSWIATLFDLNDNYVCDGSAITQKHILLPAHCIFKKGAQQQTHASAMYFQFLVSDESDGDPRNSTKILIEDFIRHSHWDPVSERHAGDVAIAVLKQEIMATMTISTICLNLQPIVDNTNVTFITRSEDFLDIQKSAESAEQSSFQDIDIVVHPFPVCTNPTIINIVWARSFCSELQGNSGQQDGIAVQMQADVERLTGMSSVSPTKSDHVVFADIQQYLDWIYDTIFETF